HPVAEYGDHPPRSTQGPLRGPWCRRAWDGPALRRLGGGSPEHGDGLAQAVGLLLQTIRRGGGLLHQRGVLLRHLVELAHRDVDLAEALGLLACGTADLADQIA